MMFLLFSSGNVRWALGRGVGGSRMAGAEPGTLVWERLPLVSSWRWGSSLWCWCWFVIVMVYIYHREKCARWKRKRTLSERYGFAKVGHRHWLLCCRHHHELIVIMISQRWIIWCNFKESKKTNVRCCWINFSSQESVQRHPHPQIEGAFLVSKKIICIFHPFPQPLGFSFFPPV